MSETVLKLSFKVSQMGLRKSRHGTSFKARHRWDVPTSLHKSVTAALGGHTPPRSDLWWCRSACLLNTISSYNCDHSDLGIHDGVRISGLGIYNTWGDCNVILST